MVMAVVLIALVCLGILFVAGYATRDWEHPDS